jgi:hypothetical protein
MPPIAAMQPQHAASAPVRRILESVQRIDARLEAEVAGAWRGAQGGDVRVVQRGGETQEGQGIDAPIWEAASGRATANRETVGRGIRQYAAQGVPTYDDAVPKSIGRPGGLQYYYSPFLGNARLQSTNGGLIEAPRASAVLLGVRQTASETRLGVDEDIDSRMAAVEAEAAAEAAREEQQLWAEQDAPAGGRQDQPRTVVEEGAAPDPDSEDDVLLWVQSFDGDGEPYYYNTVTNAMVWKAPSRFRPAESVPPVSDPGPPSPVDEADCSDDDEAVPTETSWTKFTDDEGDAYYYNQATGETTWIAPEGMGHQHEHSPSREVELEVAIELDVADTGVDIESVGPSRSSGMTAEMQHQVQHQMQQLVQQQAALVRASAQDKEEAAHEVQAAVGAAREATLAEAQRAIETEVAQAHHTLAAARAEAEHKLAEERVASEEREAILQQTIRVAEDELDKAAGAEAVALRMQHELEREAQLRVNAEETASAMQEEQLAAQRRAAEEHEARLAAEEEAKTATASAASAMAALVVEREAAAARAEQERLDGLAKLQLQSRVWIQLSDDDGNAFFYNTETQATSTDVPAEGYRPARPDELASLQAAVLADELAEEKDARAEAEMKARTQLNAELTQAAQQLEDEEAARRDAEEQAGVAKQLADAEKAQRLAAQQQVTVFQEEKAVEEVAHAATEERLAATMERLETVEISLQTAHAEAEKQLAEQRLAAEQAILEESARVRDDADAIAAARSALELAEAAQQRQQMAAVAEREKALAVAQARAEAEERGVLKVSEAAEQAAKHGEELAAIERERSTQMEEHWRREEAARLAAELSYTQAEQTIVAVQEAARQSEKLHAMELQETLTQEQLTRAKAEEDAAQEMAQQRRLAEEAVHKVEEDAALEVEQYRALAEEATQYAEETAGRAAEAETALQQSTAEWAAGIAGTWVRTFDEEGDPYYYNPATGETTWDVPESFEEEALDPKVVLAKLEAAEARTEQAEAMVMETEIAAAEQAAEAGTFVEQAAIRAEEATEIAGEERQRREQAEVESARANQAMTMERALVDAALSRQAQAEARAIEAERKTEEVEISLASVESPAVRAAAVADAVAQAMEQENEERQQRQTATRRSNSWSVALPATPAGPSVLPQLFPHLEPEPEQTLQPRPAIPTTEPDSKRSPMEANPPSGYRRSSSHLSVVSPLVVYNPVGSITRPLEPRKGAANASVPYDSPAKLTRSDAENPLVISSPGYSPVVAMDAAQAQQLRESAAVRAHEEATAREQAEKKAAELATMLAAAEAMLQKKQRKMAAAARRAAEAQEREEQERKAREQARAEEEGLREIERQQQERITAAAQAAAEAKILVGERAVQLQAARDSQLLAETEAADATRQTLHVLGHAVAVEGAISRAGSPARLSFQVSSPRLDPDDDQREDEEHERAERFQQEVSLAESAIQEAISLEQAAQESARQVKAELDAKSRLAEHTAEARRAVRPTWFLSLS